MMEPSRRVVVAPARTGGVTESMVRGDVTNVYYRTVLCAQQTVPVARPGVLGMRVLAVTSGRARAGLRPPFGDSAITLSKGDIVCSSARESGGFMENISTEPTVLVDTAIDVDPADLDRAIGSSALTAKGATVGTCYGREGRGFFVRRCAVTAGLLEEISATAASDDGTYRAQADRYLSMRLARLMDRAVGGQVDHAGDVEAERSSVLDDSPRAGSERVVQALSEEQRDILHAAMVARMSEPLRVADLASLIGYSQYHFQRRFQATFGCSVYQYLLGLRIEAAQDHLRRERSPSVTVVASQCGFSRVESFIRAFRDRVGTTPGRYALGDR